MANVFTSVFTNVKDTLSKLEGVLVTALTLQTLVVNFVVMNVPAEQKLVSDIFGAAAFALAVIKVILTSNTPAKPAARY
jgi:hypothetical protein